MAAIVNAATLSVGANSTTNITGIVADNPGPSRVVVRTAVTGVKLGGKDLDVSGTNYGFEMLPDVEYTLDLRPIYSEAPTDGAEGSLYVRNTTGSTVTVWWYSTPLPVTFI